MCGGLHLLNDVCQAPNIVGACNLVAVRCETLQGGNDSGVFTPVHGMSLGHNIWHILVQVMEGLWVSFFKLRSHPGRLIDECAFCDHVQDHEAHLIQLGILEDACTLPREHPPQRKACPSEEHGAKQNAIIIRHVLPAFPQASASVKHPEEWNLHEAQKCHPNHGRHYDVALSLDIQLVDVHGACKITKVATVELTRHCTCNPRFC
mmetsp:Transcript_58661/g.131124  ORF Transcript_58661/g.131124 Transcript_58661/m.131124 type:complete len:206 (-) Transcript_58661:624-1241(-)